MGVTKAASVSTAMSQPQRHDHRPGSARPTGSSGSQGMDQGMQVLSYLISGVVAYGALGWLGDHLLGTGFLLPTGIILGAALGIYLVIRRFSAGLDPSPGDASQATTTKTTKGRV